MLLGEVRLAVAGVRRPRGGEAAPQGVVGGPVEPGELLPRRQQLAEPVGAVAPVGAVGEPLGLGDELLLRRLGLGALLRPLLLARRALDGDHRGQRVEAGGEGDEVTDRVGVDDLLAQRLDRRGGLLGRQPPGGHALLEQVDLALELLEALGEELQRLLGRAGLVGPHGALAIGGSDIDGAVLGHPAPGLLTLCRVVSGLLVGAHGRPS